MKLPKVESYKINGKEIKVVRDDIPFPFPSPNFSKIRGLEVKMKQLAEDGINNVAVQDTIISRCGWGASYLAKKYGLKCYNFYSKRPQGLDFYRAMSKSFGAEVIPVDGTHQKIAKHYDEKWLKSHKINEYHFLPIGLSLPETITEHIKLISKLPSNLFEGTLVVCVSSGTIITGILAGLVKNNYSPDVKGVQIHNWSNRWKTICERVFNSTGQYIRTNKSLLGHKKLNFSIVDTGFTYNQIVEEPPPFPCDQYLDRKAWFFLNKFHNSMKEPITFWNIGGEWNPDTGIDNGLRGDGKVTQEKINKYIRIKQ